MRAATTMLQQKRSLIHL